MFKVQRVVFRKQHTLNGVQATINIYLLNIAMFYK